MKTMAAAFAALTLCFTFSSMAHAAGFTIDDFTSPDAGQTISVSGVGVGGPNTVTGLAGVVGGSRTLEVNVATSDHTLNSTLTVTPTAPGTLSFSNDSGQNATGTVLWDNDGAGLGGLDITNGGTLPYLQTKIIDSDLDVGFQVDITETAAAGGSTATWFANLGPGVTYVNQALASFTNAGDVDFTQVDSILLTLTGPDAQDSTLDLLEVTNTPVPEPATLAFLALGGLGLAGKVIRRRRKMA
jgi:hypothetical protein